MAGRRPDDFDSADSAEFATRHGADTQRRSFLRRWFREGSVLRRTFANAARLLGGKAVAGVLGLGYLALTARSLDPGQFGLLVLIHSYVLIVSGVVKFRSWQAVVRYGVNCLEPEKRRDFHDLIKFTTLLDLMTAILGALVAVYCAALVGDWLNWSPEVKILASTYGWLILFMIEATPTGVLRIFDRFDLLAFQSIVTPLTRLIGVVYASQTGAGLDVFVFIWFASGAVGRVTLWILGWFELYRRGYLADLSYGLSELAKPHDGIWKFVWLTNFNASLGLMLGHATALAVGATLGAADAGLFKIAQDFSKVTGKPFQLIAQSVYPDLAKLWNQGRVRATGKLVLRSALVTGCAAVGVYVVIAALGEYLLLWTVGAPYLGAYGLMILLVLGKAIGAFGIPLVPVLYAMGRAGVVLRINVVTTLFYFPLLLWLLEIMGGIGAGQARLVWSSFTVLITGVVVWVLIRRDQPPKLKDE